MGAPNESSAPQTPKTPREKSLPLSPHGHTARFLFHMLEHVDLRSVNWQEVADGVGIAKGSTAKSRYMRFKKQIESQIQGDAIQVKKEKQIKEETGLQTVESPNVSAFSTPKRSRATCDDEDEDNDDDEDITKKIKLEGAPYLRRKNHQASSVVSIDGDNDVDEDGNSSIYPSLLRSIYIKPEPDITHNNLTPPSTSQPPRSPFIKSEPGIHRSYLNYFPISHSSQTIQYHPSANTAPASSFPSQSLPSTATTAGQQRPCNYRSPWAVREEEESRRSSVGVIGSGNGGRSDGRAQKNSSWESGKGSATEPFSIN